MLILLRLSFLDLKGEDDEHQCVISRTFVVVQILPELSYFKTVFMMYKNKLYKMYFIEVHFFCHIYDK